MSWLLSMLLPCKNLEQKICAGPSQMQLSARAMLVVRVWLRLRSRNFSPAGLAVHAGRSRAIMLRAKRRLGGGRVSSCSMQPAEQGFSRGIGPDKFVVLCMTWVPRMAASDARSRASRVVEWILACVGTRAPAADASVAVYCIFQKCGGVQKEAVFNFHTCGGRIGRAE